MNTQKFKNTEISNINTEKTFVLLIGATMFPNDNSINAIPNITQNIKQLKKVMLDENYLNIPEQNITVSLNDSKLEIERKLLNITRKARNHNYTLLIYYSGHGILSSENFKLYLTTKDSTKEYLESDSINIDRFREIVSNSRASKKVVILDACHSGQIHNTMNDLSSKLNSQLKKFEGTYVMTSASEDEPSLFPHEDTKRPTYFTAKLIDVLKNGIENNKPFFSIGDVYSEIYDCFKTQTGLPLPQQSIFQNANEIIISKNRRYNSVNSNFSAESQFSYKNMRDAMINNMQKVTSVNLQKKKLNFKKYFIIATILFIGFTSGIIGYNIINNKLQAEAAKIVNIERPTMTDSLINTRKLVLPANKKAIQLIAKADKLISKG